MAVTGSGPLRADLQAAALGRRLGGGAALIAARTCGQRQGLALAAAELAEGRAAAPLMVCAASDALTAALALTTDPEDARRIVRAADALASCDAGGLRLGGTS